MLGSKRLLLALAAVALSAATPAVSSATSTVTIGSLIKVANNGAFPVPSTFMALATGVHSPRYSVPAHGTEVLSFSVMGNLAQNVKVQLKLFRRAATIGAYTVVGQSPVEAVTPGVLNTFAVKIPVHPGDILGLSDDSGHAPIFAYRPWFSLSDHLGAMSRNVARLGTSVAPVESPGGFRLNVSAVVQVG